MRTHILGLALALCAVIAVPAIGQEYGHGVITPKKVITRDGVVSHGPMHAVSSTVTTSHTAQQLETFYMPWQWAMGAQTATTGETTLEGLGTGGPITTGNLNSSGVTGLGVGAANDTFTWVAPVPWNMDVSRPITLTLACHINAAAQSGDQVGFALTYAAITPNSGTLGNAVSAAATNFTTTAWAVDNAAQAIGGATIAGGSFASNAQMMNLKVRCQELTNYSANEVTIVGLMITYHKRFL